MEVSATDMHGSIASAPAAAIAPREAVVSSGSGQTSGEESAPLSNAQVEQMVQQMQSYLDSMSVSIQYSFYGANGDKVAVNVVNRDTGEVIREIPAKEMQILQTKIGELVGMIFNDNA
jgi:flagellar protein FlaG